MRNLSFGAASFGMKGGKGGFTSERIGRGHWVGGYSKSPVRARARRVIIKIRIIKLAGSGYARAMSHLKYIEREGGGQDGKEERD